VVTAPNAKVSEPCAVVSDPNAVVSASVGSGTEEEKRKTEREELEGDLVERHEGGFNIRPTRPPD
jgi:hypothetical protein